MFEKKFKNPFIDIRYGKPIQAFRMKYAGGRLNQRDRRKLPR
jgi:uncharacterized membrane protein